MTRKEYNAVINECKTETCYYCGTYAKTLCNNLQKVGYIVGNNLIYWDALTEAQKLKVQSAEGYPVRPEPKKQNNKPKNGKRGSNNMAKSKWGNFNDKVDLKGLAEDVKNADGSGGNFPTIPKGKYEVELATLEVKPTKKDGRPMVSTSFKILTGEYKGQRIFDNKVIYGTKNDGNSIKSTIGFLESMDSGVALEFIDYDQFEGQVLDVCEAVMGNLEYAIEYDPDEYFSVSIVEVFEVEESK